MWVSRLVLASLFLPLPFLGSVHVSPAGGAWGRPHVILHLFLDASAGEAFPVWSLSSRWAMPGVRPSRADWTSCLHRSYDSSEGSLTLLICISSFRSVTSALAHLFSLSLSSSLLPPNPSQFPCSTWAHGNFQTLSSHTPPEEQTLPGPDFGLRSCSDVPGRDIELLDSPGCILEAQHCSWAPPVCIPQISGGIPSGDPAALLPPSSTWPQDSLLTSSSPTLSSTLCPLPSSRDC